MSTPMPSRKQPTNTTTISSSSTTAVSSRLSTFEAQRDDCRLTDPSTSAASSHEACSTNGVLGADVICCERAGAAHFLYRGKSQSTGQVNRAAFQLVGAQSGRNLFADFASFLRSCLLPEGYPESVAPSYTNYMCWRALQYFFGGAMGVFTTQSLLHAVGVSSHGAASSVVAVNWVIKDGAGRIGKLLSARHGKKFDCDLKQLRFAGHLLMELGAAVELSTVGVPFLFLPLACAANVTKNVAAVSSTSTRAPIYKAFALKENIGDVTAKGECISNVADLMGTGLGILTSRNNPSLLTTFMVLSFGYIYSSYHEVKAVVMPTLNRSRFGVAVQLFLERGHIPSVREVNQKERIILPLWAPGKPVELGSRIKDAFQTPQMFFSVKVLFEKEQYLVTFHPTRRQAYVILKENATSNDVMQGTFHAHVLLHILRQGCINKSNKKVLAGMHDASMKRKMLGSLQESFGKGLQESDIMAALAESCRHSPQLYESFKLKAEAQGWIMGESFLCPGTVRLCI